MVWAMLAAANRDPARFPDPDRFDIGARRHRPPGVRRRRALLPRAHLARLEAQVAIGALVRRFDELALESDTVEWGRSLFRVPGTLPISFRRA